jgi:arylsulfatase A-like enzyme
MVNRNRLFQNGRQLLQQLLRIFRAFSSGARLGGIVALFLLVGGFDAAAKSSRPNILFISVDDLNDWVGFLKMHPDVRTPNLDRLAKRGVAFTRAYTAAPACNPSRAAVLSGLRPSTTGIYGNPDAWSKSQALPGSVQLPEHFRNAGYHTMWVGKLWHTSDATQPPEERLARMWNDKKHRQGGYGPFPSEVGIAHPPLKGGFFDFHIWDGPDTDFADVRNAGRVIEFLKSEHDKPFFLALGFYRPHNPWTAPRRFFEMYDVERIALPPVHADDLADIPPAGRLMAQGHTPDHKALVEAGLWRPLVQAYLACVTFMDSQLGRVLDALDRSPHAQNTIIMLWSDHGFHHGEKERWTKFALWEVATRSPMIIHVPGMKHAGARVATPVSLLDIYPTLIDLAGLPKPASKLEGESLRPILDNPAYKRHAPAIMTFGQNNHAVRSGPWRYIRYENGDEELYNLDTDPHEWENLAGKSRSKPALRELKQFLPTENVAPAGTAGALQKRRVAPR